MYCISLTPENHGYQIRLLRFEVKLVTIEEQKTTKMEDTFREISTLAIEDNLYTAQEIMHTINTLINVMVEKEIIDKNVFRYKEIKL